MRGTSESQELHLFPPVLCNRLNPFNHPLMYRSPESIQRGKYHLPSSGCLGNEEIRIHENIYFVYIVMVYIYGLFLFSILQRYYEEMEERYEFELRIRGEEYPPPGHRPPALVYISFTEMLAIVLSIGLALGNKLSICESIK